MNGVRKTAWRSAFALCCTLALPAAAKPVGQPLVDGFAYARAPYRFVFPRDHAAHPDYRTEWWYYTGHVHTKDGRRFGYELTFFRFGLHPGDPAPQPGQSRWRGNELFPAHFAITDEAGQRFTSAERIAREALGDGMAAATRLEVRSGDWSLQGTPLRNVALERMVLHAAAGEDAIDFVQIPEKPPAIHGSGGVSRKSACASCASHYYSYTRLHTSGTLTYDGVRRAVEGLSWMDHEYGSSELAPAQAGWDWFSLQLDDGREIMFYRLRQRDGTLTPESSGSLIERDGLVRPLTLTDFLVASGGVWHSPHTGASYPDRWRIRLPKQHLDLELTPTVADQELTGSSSYWEGAVDIRDAAQGNKLVGAGYVELTGYAKAVRL